MMLHGTTYFDALWIMWHTEYNMWTPNLRSKAIMHKAKLRGITWVLDKPAYDGIKVKCILSDSSNHVF